MYVLMTWAGTVLCVARNRTLAHKKIFQWDDFVLCFNSPQRISFERVDELSIQATRPGIDGAYVLKSPRGYVSARPGGSIDYVEHCAEWEKFFLVPLENSYQPLPELTLAASQPGAQIPAIIHQTYSTRDLPSVCRQNVERMLALNPGWTYRYWSDRDAHDFIYEKFGWEILSLYGSINRRYGAARADLLRYLLIYSYGGVYLDIKSGANRPFAEMFSPNDAFVISQWPAGGGFQGFGRHHELSYIAGGEFQQWHVIGAPGHPFLEAVLKRVLRNLQIYDEQRDGVGRSAVLRLTGPIAYTLAIHPELALHPHRKIDAAASGLAYEATPRPDKGFNYATHEIPLI